MIAQVMSENRKTHIIRNTLGPYLNIKTTDLLSTETKCYVTGYLVIVFTEKFSYNEFQSCDAKNS